MFERIAPMLNLQQSAQNVGQIIGISAPMALE